MSPPLSPFSSPEPGSPAEVAQPQDEPSSSTAATESQTDPHRQQQKQQHRTSTVAELVGTPFEAFDPAQIIEAYEKGAREDEEFREQFKMKVSELLVRTHAWATARFALEARQAEAELEHAMDAIAERERAQEQTRRRLAQFIASVKSALAVLQGIV